MKEKTRKTVAIWLLGLGMITLPLLNIGAAWLLRKSCSPVMRVFFRRYLTATVGFIFGGGILVQLFKAAWQKWIISSFPSCPAWIESTVLSILILLIAGGFMVLLMSSSGLITRYYRLDDVTASKVRLFQTGTICCCIPLLGLLLVFLGLKGIIRSDLLSEERGGEDCGVVSGGWWSRPVIAMACFYGCLSVLGGLSVIISVNL